MHGLLRLPVRRQEKERPGEGSEIKVKEDRVKGLNWCKERDNTKEEDQRWSIRKGRGKEREEPVDKVIKVGFSDAIFHLRFPFRSLALRLPLSS